MSGVIMVEERKSCMGLWGTPITNADIATGATEYPTY